MTDIGSFFSTIIYLISASLLYPTLVLLVAGFLWVILYAGGVCAEWLERFRLKPCPAESFPEAIANGNDAGLLPHRVKDYVARLRRLQEGHLPADVQIENLVQDVTLTWWKSMDRLRIMVRLGPSLGLMGTLIPMGTGLASLDTGDMTRLSSDLVIAFTTTVVGLAIGMTAYCMYTIKRRWIEEDIKNMELATELLANPRECAQS
ncbi:MAG: MotA/TolQ/ExbB proton channel family protein [Pseudomonadota bacterium]